MVGEQLSGKEDLSEEGTSAEPTVRPLGTEHSKQRKWEVQMLWYGSVMEMFVNSEKVHDAEPQWTKAGAKGDEVREGGQRSSFRDLWAVIGLFMLSWMQQEVCEDFDQGDGMILFVG